MKNCSEWGETEHHPYSKWVTAVHLINFFMSEGINSGIQKKNSEGIRSRFG